MKNLFILTAFLSIAICSCHPVEDTRIEGIWQSLWEKDMKLQLHLGEKNQFKVVLNRTGQVHTNLGWYSVKGDVLMIKDSVDYPLPVCNLTDTGRYNFTIIKDTLSFTVIDDKCERRSQALQLERFIRTR